MKISKAKFVSAILAVSLLGLTGCGGGGGGGSSATSSSAPATTSSSATPATNTNTPSSTPTADSTPSSTPTGQIVTLTDAEKEKFVSYDAKGAWPPAPPMFK